MKFETHMVCLSAFNEDAEGKGVFKKVLPTAPMFDIWPFLVLA